MNNEIDPTTEAGTEAEPLNTHSDLLSIWEQTDVNKDVYVQVADPLITGTVRARGKVIPQAVVDGKGKAIKFAFEILDPIKTVEGKEKAPGWTWRERFGQMFEAPTEDLKEKERALRGRKFIYDLAVKVKFLKRNAQEQITNGEIYAFTRWLNDKRPLMVRFWVGQGKTKKDEVTGEMYRPQYQNFALSLLKAEGEAGALSTEAVTAEAAPLATEAPVEAESLI